MKPIHVGYYQAGYDTVEIRLVAGSNGCFYNVPKVGKVGLIEIGIDSVNQSQLYNVVLHEITEFVMGKMLLRYAPTGTKGNDMAEYVFHMSHVQFTEVCARVANVLNACMADVVKHWRAYHRTKRSK